MNMEPDFPRLRIQRARKHFDDLIGLLDSYFHGKLPATVDLLTNEPRSSPYFIREERHPELGHYVYRLVVLQYPPPSLTSVVGDLVHNLRASLDNLMWELCGCRRDPDNRDTFPIYDKEPAKGFDSKRSQFPKLSDEAFEVIKHLQPYHRWHDANDTLGALSLLHLLSNSDKHRTPQLGVLRSTGARYALPGAGLDLDGYEVHEGGGPFEDGTEVARFTFPPGEEPDIDISFTFDVAFYERSNEARSLLASWRNFRWLYRAVCDVVFVHLGPHRASELRTDSIPAGLLLSDG